MTEQKNIIAVDEFGGKYFINEFYRPIAEALQEKFKELKYVPVLVVHTDAAYLLCTLPFSPGAFW